MQATVRERGEERNVLTSQPFADRLEMLCATDVTVDTAHTALW